MGVVCENREIANYLMNTSEKILEQLHEGTYQYESLDEHTLMGILTLENVIERILSMEIKDEKDVEHKQNRNQLVMSTSNDDLRMT